MSLESGRSQKRIPERNAYKHLREIPEARNFNQLPLEERDKAIEETGSEMLDMLRESGAIEFKSMEGLYKALQGERMIVRREAPEKLIDLLLDGIPVKIDFPTGERYSNAVEWTPSLGSRGLDNAYLEGYGHLNGIVLVIGFKQGEKDVVSMEDASQKFAGLDRAFVRSVKGTVLKSDLMFVTVRIPSFAFPETEMTERELEMHDAYLERKAGPKNANPFFIHRGFLFSENMQKH